MLHDLPILPEERHDIGDRAQGDDVEIVREGLAAHLLPKRLAELERHAHARDVLVGIWAVCAMRVDDGEGFGQFLAR